MILKRRFKKPTQSIQTLGPFMSRLGSNFTNSDSKLVCIDSRHSTTFQISINKTKP